MNREDWVHIDTYAREVDLRDERIDELEETVKSLLEDEQFYLDAIAKLEKRVKTLEHENSFLEHINARIQQNDPITRS
jgi:uncharacterized protein (DUF3084 family)